jgi:hypothetical protein
MKKCGFRFHKGNGKMERIGEVRSGGGTEYLCRREVNGAEDPPSGEN